MWFNILSLAHFLLQVYFSILEASTVKYITETANYINISTLHVPNTLILLSPPLYQKC